MKVSQSQLAATLAAVAEAAVHASQAALAAARAVSVTHPEEVTLAGPFAEVRPGTFASRPTPGFRAFQRNGRVQFCCPACRRPTSVAARYRGKLVKCPRCSTGIRVPDPVRKIAAENFGRTLLPMLRPAAFPKVPDVTHAGPILLSRLPSARESMIAGVFVVMFLVAGALAPFLLQWSLSGASLARAVMVTEATATPQDPTSEARTVVESFLAAATPEEKASWVMHPETTLPLIKDWFVRRPEEVTSGGEITEEPRQGYYAGGGTSVSVSEVHVTLPGEGRSLTYLVEHHAEGARIAWPESVGYSPLEWEDVVRRPVDAPPVRLRVLACMDDYYNYAFGDESKYCCVRLHDAQTLKQLGYGYTPRTRAMDGALRASLPPAEANLLQPVMVEVRSTPDAAFTGQVEIVGSVVPGWNEKVEPLTGETYAMGRAK